MDILHWLKALIQYDTTSHRSNLQLIDFVDHFLKEQGFLTQIFLNKHQNKANLLATIPAKNGSTHGGLLLSGHSDTVPTTGQNWSSDPYTTTIIDGKIYGRGTCDMKGYIAVLLALVPKFKTLSLNKPIHFALTFDEEIGCFGAEQLVEQFKKINFQPEACLIGEPSSMRPVVGCKSRVVYHCQIQGKDAHSSQFEQGCNAVEYASFLITYISKLAQTFKHKGPFDLSYDIPYTTISTNLIQGGIAENIIPGHCAFTLEIRYIPSFDCDAFYHQLTKYIDRTLRPRMKEKYAQAEIFLTQMSQHIGFHADENSKISKITQKSTDVYSCQNVSYFTEAGIFQEAGIPTLICGPGDIRQAHQPDEYVTIEQLQRCEEILERVVMSFCM